MKSYIRDGVYADFDGESVILTTEDGYSVQNTIVLGASELVSLIRYVDREMGTKFSRGYGR